MQAATKSQEIELGLDTPSNCEDTREKLGAHCFKLDYEASSERAIVRRSVPWILTGALLSLVILVICGCSFPSIGIEVLGKNRKISCSSRCRDINLRSSLLSQGWLV